jgi:hypothetical protein
MVAEFDAAESAASVDAAAADAAPADSTAGVFVAAVSVVFAAGVAVESVVEVVAACCSPADAAPELLPESAIPAGVVGQNHHTQNASNRHRITAAPAMLRGRVSAADGRSGGGRLGGLGPETTAGADTGAGAEAGADVGAVADACACFPECPLAPAAGREGLTDFAERDAAPGGFNTAGKASANGSGELLPAALTVV